MSDTLIGGVTVLVVIVVGFFALRALMLWYWKVDTQLALLQEISASLKRIEASSTVPPVAPGPLANVPTSFERVIPPPLTPQPRPTPMQWEAPPHSRG